MEMVMATVMAMATAMAANMEAGITWKTRKAFYCHSGGFSVNRKKYLKEMHHFLLQFKKNNVTEGSEAVESSE
jgi:hypothetical protein